MASIEHDQLRDVEVAGRHLTGTSARGGGGIRSTGPAIRGRFRFDDEVECATAAAQDSRVEPVGR
ncbi:MAG TPA: hypothetical protein VHW23_13815, partial [Kofleriaceae bacterium]|nr:hypothetical protein [Kofleriaceae bacterium]